LALICRRPTMEIGENQKKPRAPFSIKPKRKKQLMKWLKNLKLPDGYAAGFRRSVNLKTGKFFGLKSHDYHIVMERLLPVMFRGFVKNDVWKALVELSYFYRHLCAKEIKKEMIEKLEQQLPILVGTGHYRQVNMVLGNLVRLHWPGLVTLPTGESIPATTWEHYRYDVCRTFGNTQALVWDAFWV
jgi:hypothetical protein